LSPALSVKSKPSWAALLVTLAVAGSCERDDLSLGDGHPDASAASGGLQAGSAGVSPAGAGGRAAAGAGGEAGQGPPEPPVFSEPTVIAELSDNDTANDDDPSLTADLTEIYFNSDRADSNEDIWRSVRGNETDDWPAPEPATTLNSPDRETGIALAPDGLSIWFSSDRGGDDLDVYVARRDHRSDDWFEPELDPDLSTDDDDLVSSISPDALTIYLARRSSDSDDYDIFVAQRAAVVDPWEPAAALDEMNSDAAESDASPVQGRWGLLFTRDEDLYLAQRTALDGPFASPKALEDLNSGSDDRDGWASNDFGYVVFSSDREGHYQLFEALR
jgi:hypothetical protein